MPYWLITYSVKYPDGHETEPRTWTGEAPDENEAVLSACFADSATRWEDKRDRKSPPKPEFNEISVEEIPRPGVRFPEWVEGEDPF